MNFSFRLDLIRIILYNNSVFTEGKMEYFYNLLFYFMIYSFAGWCGEVIFATIRHGKFVNRGMLKGAYCPIYGFGLIIVIVCLSPLKDTWFSLFIFSALLTSALELVTGFVLDKLFNRKWWDYSNRRFNLGGYICPLFSVLWGAACVAIIKFINPLVEMLVGFIYKPVGIVILFLFYSVIITDVILTIPEIAKLKKDIKLIEILEKQITAGSDAIGSNISEKTAAAVEFSQERRAEAEKSMSELRDKMAAAASSIKERTEQEQAKLKEQLSELKARNKRIMNAFPALKGEKLSQRIKKKINKK